MPTSQMPRRAHNQSTYNVYFTFLFLVDLHEHQWCIVDYISHDDEVLLLLLKNIHLSTSFLRRNLFAKGQNVPKKVPNKMESALQDLVETNNCCQKKHRKSILRLIWSFLAKRSKFEVQLFFKNFYPSKLIVTSQMIFSTIYSDNQTNVQLCSSQVDKGKSDKFSEKFFGVKICWVNIF